MNYDESDAWRPGLKGWSRDILPFYADVAKGLPHNARVVEVGTALGRSTIFMAERLLASGKASSYLWGVDPYPKTWETNWYKSALYSFCEHASGEEMSLIHLLRGDSEDVSKMFLPAFLDFVFIDGMHGYDDVRHDILSWLPKLKKGAMIAGHDYGPMELKEGPSHYPTVKQAVDSVFGADRVQNPAGSIWSVTP